MTKDKTSAGASRHTFFTALLIVGIVLFATFTYDGSRRLQSTLEETIDFAKLRIMRLGIYQTDDRVKSLTRLLDKSTELAENISQWRRLDECSAERLGTYITDQRITGALVLDDELNVVMEASEDAAEDGGAAKDMWQELIQSSYINDILLYPQKTYVERMETDGGFCDVAAVARKDAPGMILTYVRKEGILSEGMSMETLFTGFPFEMGGIVAVSDGDRIVGTNSDNLQGRTIDECRELFVGGLNPNDDGIIRLRAGNGIWYGQKARSGIYSIYMFFPAHQVFMRRNIICSGYLLVAIVIYLIHVLGRSNAEKAVLEREQKRLRIIRSIGYAYTSITLVDLHTGEIEMVKDFDGTIMNHPKIMPDKTAQQENARRYVAEPFQEAFLEFLDMDTVAQRLARHKTLSFTFCTQNGGWVQSLLIPNRYGEGGDVESVLIANRDVTAEREHDMAQETALRNALRAAEHANRSKTNFLSNMSHDIRTPMNAIIGFTALAVSHIDSRQTVLEYLKKIDISGKHLLALINDILDMSRIESGNVRLESAPVHLPDVLDELKTILQGSADAKRQRLSIETRNVTHEDVITDKLRLTQVLINIASNAVKYTQEAGTIDITVTERPCDEAGHSVYEISVKDDGIGVDREFQEHIFDLFARERNTTESGVQGAGLGLAIARNIVEMMNGTITLKSEKGKGSEFVVILKLQYAAVGHDAETGTITVAKEISDAAEERPDGAASDTGADDRKKDIRRHAGLKILLAEDNELNREIATALMQEAGLIVDAVEDGSDAVERVVAAPEDRYDLIFMDIQMPRMDGYTATKEIRTLNSNRKANIPIYAMTANAFDEDRDKALMAGMNGHISKPISLEVILQELDREFRKDTDERV